MSAAAVATDYRNNLRMSKSSEEVSDSFVDNALTLNKRALTIPAVREAVDKLQDLLGTGSPWNQVSKMIKVVQKGKIPLNIEWTFVSITDLFLTNNLGPGDIVSRNGG